MSDLPKPSSILPNGTPVKVSTPNGQIYFGVIVDSSIISGSEDYEYKVRLNSEEYQGGPLEWYPAAWVEQFQE